MQPSDVLATVCAQLRLDPIDGGAIAIGPLAAVTEASESFNGRFVALEVQAGHELSRGIIRWQRRRVRFARAECERSH